MIVMGDLPEDADVSASPKNAEVTLTVGFLNDKVWICLIHVLFILFENKRSNAVPFLSLSL